MYFMVRESEAKGRIEIDREKETSIGITDGRSLPVYRRFFNQNRKKNWASQMGGFPESSTCS
jgi:hypothetical protein